MGRHFDIDAHVQIPMSVALQILYSLAFQPEHGPRLGARRDVNSALSFQGRNVDFRAQNRLNEANRYFAQHVFTFTLKNIIRLNMKDYTQISHPSSPPTPFSF